MAKLSMYFVLTNTVWYLFVKTSKYLDGICCSPNKDVCNTSTVVVLHDYTGFSFRQLVAASYATIFVWSHQ